jgi:hypothetical protein
LKKEEVEKEKNKESKGKSERRVKILEEGRQECLECEKEGEEG